jgi:hypothetical protein
MPYQFSSFKNTFCNLTTFVFNSTGLLVNSYVLMNLLRRLNDALVITKIIDKSDQCFICVLSLDRQLRVAVIVLISLKTGLCIDNSCKVWILCRCDTKIINVSYSMSPK